MTRTPCDTTLARYVEHHWTLAWDLPDGVHHRSETLPHPACHLTVEHGAGRPEVGADPVVLTGVVTRRFEVDVRGRAWVHGVKFRPGGLAALTGLDARTLADRTVPAAGLVPPDVVSAVRELAPGTPTDLASACVDAALAPHVDAAGDDPAYDLLLGLVADVLGDRSVLRIDDLERRAGVPRRRLERLFSRYVGASPKWVLARYRMHDVVAALDAGHDGSLADLAAEHGWYDQAHFTRDFTALVGVPPGAYVRRGAAGRSRADGSAVFHGD
ncbi:MAG: transcriptional regulator [Nocardioides sp.]|nr:transcriptional regulator [Nocardioides sp.]